MASAAQDLNDKLKLEAKFRPVLDAYNTVLVRKFTREFGLRDNVLNFSQEDDALAAILLAQYERTGDVFDDRIRGNLPDDVAITDTESAAIAAALATFYPSLAEEHARGINRTTQGDASDAVAFAREEQIAAASEGNIVTKLEAAAIAGAALHRKLRGRLITTVMTETQAVAEAAKATEAEVLSGMPPSVAGGSPQQKDIDKEWETVGDDKVREEHVAADGQRRKVNEPFDVGGEQLRWPGDAGLGASLGNIINCRCGAGYDEQGIIDNRRAQERAS